MNKIKVSIISWIAIIFIIWIVSTLFFLNNKNDTKNKSLNNNSSGNIINENQKDNITEKKYILNSIAYVNNINWNVDVKPKSWWSKKWLKISDLLYEWDTISTNSWSDISIIFVDDTIIRLPESSSFIIKSETDNDIKVKLNKWSIWWRIIKPFASENTFSFDDETISASVRWTAIYMEILDNGKSNFIVIDSNKEKSEDALIVTIKETWKKIWLKAEEKILYNKKDNTFGTWSIEIKKLFSENNLINANTKNDLIFMHKLLDENTSSWNTKMIEVIKKEIYHTKPKKEEFKSFFDNEEIFEENNNDIITLISKDELISKVKSNKKIKDKKIVIKQILNVDKIKYNDDLQKVIIIKDLTKEDLDIINNLEIKKSKNIEEIKPKYSDKIMEKLKWLYSDIKKPIVKKPIVTKTEVKKVEIKKPTIEKNEVKEPTIEKNEVKEPIVEKNEEVEKNTVEKTTDIIPVEKKLFSDEF